MNSQKEAFIKYEANSWFERNKTVVDKFNENDDYIIKLLDSYKIQPQKFLEIVSSAGYRLNAIKTKYSNCEVYGIDPSTDAVEYGKIKYPHVNLNIGTIDKLPFESHFFDVLLVGFVCYVVDRELLLQSIAEVDRVLKNNGYLIIVDFFSESPVKNKYEHISDFQAYSFKQKYEDIFVSSHLYQLLDKSTYFHGSKELDAQSDFHDLMSVSMLKKDLHASYK